MQAVTVILPVIPGRAVATENRDGQLPRMGQFQLRL